MQLPVRVSVTLTDGSVRAGVVRPAEVKRTTDRAGPGLVELQFVAM